MRCEECFCFNVSKFESDVSCAASHYLTSPVTGNK